MPRYIDADELMEQMENACMGVMSGCDPFNQPLKVLESAPTADVVERKRGKWVRKEIHSNWSDWTEYTCSLCGATFKGLYKANFCPNCGAEMG